MKPRDASTEQRIGSCGKRDRQGVDASGALAMARGATGGGSWAVGECSVAIKGLVVEGGCRGGEGWGCIRMVELVRIGWE